MRSSVEPITVNVEEFSDTFTTKLIPALSAALDASERPVRALILTNPHNPFGQCYPKEVLAQCVKFCQQHGIHYVSDEVYALSVLAGADLEDRAPFTSALSLDLQALGCAPEYVHTIWSVSKDFGSSGIRMVRTVSPGPTAPLTRSRDASSRRQIRHWQSGRRWAQTRKRRLSARSRSRGCSDRPRCRI